MLDESAVWLMEKTKAELALSEENINGEIHMGSGETEAVSIIAKVAKVLQEKYPLICYRLYSGDACHIIEKLNRGLIDFGLLVQPVDITKYGFIELPIKDIWGVLMRKDSPLAQKDSICAEDLWDKPLIIFHQTTL